MRGLLSGLGLCGLVVAGLLVSMHSNLTPEISAQSYPIRARLPLLAADNAPAVAPVTPTPTPTPGLAPSATPSPTHTPIVTPTSTPQPSGVYAHHGRWYVSSTGSIRVVGLVTNGLLVPIDFVEITANFYSATGQLLASDYGFSDVRTLAAGTSSPYTVLLIDPPQGIADVEVQVTDYDSTPYRPPVSGLAVQVTNIYRSSIGTVHVVGTVKNNSATSYTYVQPIAAFVGSDGYVIRTDYTFSSPDDLGPGASGTYDMLFIDAPAGMESENLLIWVDASLP